VQQPEIITVEGSGGFVVCARTGHRVTPGSEVPPDYDSVLAVDLVEYREWSDFPKDLLKDLKARGSCPAPALSLAPQMIDWTPRPMDSAPRDGTPILACCQHAADPYVEEGVDHLTAYGSHCEAFGHVADGWHVVEWWTVRHENEGESLPPTVLPAWWFLSGTEGEMPANPVAWLPVPLDWTPPPLSEEVANAAEAA
jgi:hypothetical protein